MKSFQSVLGNQQWKPSLIKIQKPENVVRGEKNSPHLYNIHTYQFDCWTMMILSHYLTMFKHIRCPVEFIIIIIRNGVQTFALSCHILHANNCLTHAPWCWPITFLSLNSWRRSAAPDPAILQHTAKTMRSKLAWHHPQTPPRPQLQH